jgi:hypothetical protein
MEPILTDPAHLLDQSRLVETYERLRAALIESRGLASPVVSHGASALLPTAANPVVGSFPAGGDTHAD